MHFIENSAQMQGGAISVRAPSVAIDSNILLIFNTRCFIEYEVTTEPFSLDPVLWEVMSHLCGKAALILNLVSSQHRSLLDSSTIQLV